MGRRRLRVQRLGRVQDAPEGPRNLAWGGPGRRKPFRQRSGSARSGGSRLAGAVGPGGPRAPVPWSPRRVSTVRLPEPPCAGPGSRGAPRPQVRVRADRPYRSHGRFLHGPARSVAARRKSSRCCARPHLPVLSADCARPALPPLPLLPGYPCLAPPAVAPTPLAPGRSTLYPGSRRGRLRHVRLPGGRQPHSPTCSSGGELQARRPPGPRPGADPATPGRPVTHPPTAECARAVTALAPVHWQGPPR